MSVMPPENENDIDRARRRRQERAAKTVAVSKVSDSEIVVTAAGKQLFAGTVADYQIKIYEWWQKGIINGAMHAFLARQAP